MVPFRYSTIYGVTLVHQLLNITKALSDESRVRILMFLRGRELCLCQINEVLGLATSTVSKHMSVLTQTGLVQVRKEGRWRYFRLPGDDAPRLVKECLAWLEAALAAEVAVAQDNRRVRAIEKIPCETICAASRTRGKAAPDGATERRPERASTT